MYYLFQSSFELTGYITIRMTIGNDDQLKEVSKLFRAYRLYNKIKDKHTMPNFIKVSKLFRAYRLYNDIIVTL